MNEDVISANMNQMSITIISLGRHLSNSIYKLIFPFVCASLYSTCYTLVEEHCVQLESNKTFNFQTFRFENYLYESKVRNLS